MLLFAELSRLYEVGRGAPKGHFGNIHEEAKSASSLPKESVLEKTAREVGVSPRTIDNARRYAREEIMNLLHKKALKPNVDERSI